MNAIEKMLAEYDGDPYGRELDMLDDLRALNEKGLKGCTCEAPSREFCEERIINKQCQKRRNGKAAFLFIAED